MKKTFARAMGTVMTYLVTHPWVNLLQLAWLVAAFVFVQLYWLRRPDYYSSSDINVSRQALRDFAQKQHQDPASYPVYAFLLPRQSRYFATANRQQEARVKAASFPELVLNLVAEENLFRDIFAHSGWVFFATSAVLLWGRYKILR